MTKDELVKLLTAPFQLHEVKFKPNSVKGNRALAMAYVDCRVVQDRLDSVLGVENWMDEYQILNDGSVMCQLRLRVGGEWLTKTDVGSPSEQPDGGDRLKAAFSDALKRAAVKWGIGRYLYRLPAVWADYDPQKRQFTGTPQLPAWAIPKNATQQSQQRPPPPAPQTQQQRPPAQTQPVQQQQPQQQNVSPADGAIGAVTASQSPAELEAAAFAASAMSRQGKIGQAGMVEVGDAIQSRVLHFVRDSKDKSQLDAFHAVYEKSIQPLMNATRQAAILEAFNAKLGQFQPQQQPDDEAFA